MQGIASAPSGSAIGAAVAVRDLTKSWGKVEALKRVSFEAAPGDMVAVVGPDGAGKTTLVQLLAGLIAPTAGTALVAGLDIRASGAELGKRIGYMSEGFTLYGTLSVAENLEFFADLYGVSETQRRDRIAELLRFSGLTEAMNRRASQLSGGMQKKLALSCALVHTPEVLLLDEPTSGVDPRSRQEFWRLLGRFQAEGVTIILTTTYLDEAERANRVMLLHAGAVLVIGDPKALRGSSGLHVWEVQASPLAGARAALAERFGAEHVHQARRSLLIDASDPSAEATIKEVLQQGGIELGHCVQMEPTLEDVFVAKIRDAERPVAEYGGAPERSGTEPRATGPVVSTQGLTCRFGDVVAVSNVSLEIAAGEVFGLLGPNGSGKTTFIRMLLGLQPPTAGAATLLGRSLGGGAAQRQQMGYVSQKFSLYGDLTARENLDFFGGAYGVAGRKLRERLRWVLAMTGLAPYQDLRVASLGGGVRQRLALGAALLHEPQLLFLDEPTAGVDPIRRREFWDLLYHIAGEGTTVLVTTHYLDEAERCDRLALMHRGALIAVGSPEELKAQAGSFTGGTLWMVDAAQPMRALELLTGAPGVPYVGIFGPTVRAVAQGTSPDKVQKALRSAGLEADVRRGDLTLEDAFSILVASQ